MFDGVSSTTDYQLGMLLGEEQYWRFQIDLEKGRGSDHLDDSSQANLAALRRTGETLIEDESDRIDAACAALMAG